MKFDHFLEAQDAVYETVLRELKEGEKQSHWMWFVFPQLTGLGSSWKSQRFALDSVAAASRYLEHEVLGPRLRECTQLVLDIRGQTAEQIFGWPDWLKFRSCMTLFSLCSVPDSVFQQAIDKYFAGVADSSTLALLSPPHRKAKRRDSNH